jgi:hypothetical protein
MKDWKKKIPTDPEQYSDWSCDRDDVINFIEQIISERDKEWQTWIERFKKLKGCPCMCDRCKNKLINGFK